MEHDRLMAWFTEKPVTEVLAHVGDHGGECSVETARLACRRALTRIQELEADVASFERVSRRLMKK